MRNHSKFMDFKRKEGEIYIKITDGNFNKIYEKTIGVNDKKEIDQLIKDLQHKGVELKRDIPGSDGWW